MELKSKTERLDARRPEDISRAAALLRAGGIVAFPTETVYGLGANALSSGAVAGIFEAKKRPSWDPLIVHICDREMLCLIADLKAISASMTKAAPLAEQDADELFDLSYEGPRFAKEMMDAFWPGPLTLLLPRTTAVQDVVTAGRALVGVRMPKHPVALELIRLSGVPIAAPSANLFGHTSPTTAAHVLADLDGRIDAVLDGGPTEVGVESTVAGVDKYGIVIYRPGAVTLEMLESVAGRGVVHNYVVPNEQAQVAHAGLPSPGVGLRHYAPKARLVLVEVPAFSFGGMPNVFIEAIAEALAETNKVGVMLPDGWFTEAVTKIYHWGPWSQPEVLARRLFSGLRELDDAHTCVIVCPLPNGNGISAAIRDRLQKASK